MNNQLFRIFPTHFVLALVLPLVMSCASQYTVSTNLDQKNFREYFSANEVTVYENESDIKTRYQNLAAVEGESCQTQEHHEPADEITARTDARRQAFKLGANAIVFSGCTLIDTKAADKQCITTRVCYARVFQVELSPNAND